MGWIGDPNVSTEPFPSAKTCLKNTSYEGRIKSNYKVSFEIGRSSVYATNPLEDLRQVASFPHPHCELQGTASPVLLQNELSQEPGASCFLSRRATNNTPDSKLAPRKRVLLLKRATLPGRLYGYTSCTHTDHPNHRAVPQLRSGQALSSCSKRTARRPTMQDKRSCSLSVPTTSR